MTNRKRKPDAPDITFHDLHDTTPAEAVALLRRRIRWIQSNAKEGDRLTMRNDGEFFYLRKGHK